MSQLGLRMKSIGTLNLKNIARPVEAFVLRLDTGATALPPALPAVISTPRPSRYRKVITASVVGLVAVCIATGLWLHRTSPPIAPQSVAAVTTGSLPLPDKPSIAVLPFTNIGGDAKQERQADGITEDLITDPISRAITACLSSPATRS